MSFVSIRIARRVLWGDQQEAYISETRGCKISFVYPASKWSFIILLYEPRNLHLELQQSETFLALGEFYFLFLKYSVYRCWSFLSEIKDFWKMSTIFVVSLLFTISCVCVCVCVCQSPSRVRFFATPWTVACQAPLSMEFSRQEYWSGLPFLSLWGSFQTRE